MKRLSPGLLFACLAGSGLAALWISGVLWLRYFSDKGFHYVNAALPMLVEGDAYYHLHHAQRVLAGQTEAPLLSHLGAGLTQLTGLPLLSVAFWLPMGFAALTGLCVWGWGRLLALRPWQGALASALAVLMPAYVVRVAPGRFDTDGGIALLWHLCLLGLALCSLPLSPVAVAPVTVRKGSTESVSATTGRSPLRFRRGAAMALMLGAGGLLGAFWRPGLVLLPLCFWLWGLTFFMEPNPGLRRLRTLCALLCPLLGAVALCLPSAWLPLAAAQFRESALDHLLLVLGHKDSLVGINELRALSPTHFLAMLGVYPLAGGVVLSAFGLAVWRRPRVMLFFLPSALALVAGAFSARFLYLAALPLALGVALLPTTLAGFAHGASQASPPRWLGLAGRVVPLLLLLCALIWPCLEAPRPVYNGGFDYMAQKIKAQSLPDAKIWNWWDEGYFLQARTGLPSLFDGGSQDEERLIPAAFPLACSDPQLARRWIRFFAVHGLWQGQTLRAAWGSWENVQRNMARVLAAQNPQEVQEVLAQLPPVSGLDLARPEVRTPQGQVWLYLPVSFLLYSQTWRHGDQRMTANPEALFLTSLPRGEFQVQPVEGQAITLSMDTGPLQINSVINTSRAPLTTARLLTAEPPYLISHNDAPWWHLASREGALSVAFRLLAPWGAPVPGFREVFFHPGIGGVWEVLP